MESWWLGHCYCFMCHCSKKTNSMLGLLGEELKIKELQCNSLVSIYGMAAFGILCTCFILKRDP